MSNRKEQEPEVKTIIFADISAKDKNNFLNFLVEKDLNFTQDSQGRYLTYIKLRNMKNSKQKS